MHHIYQSYLQSLALLVGDSCAFPIPIQFEVILSNLVKVLSNQLHRQIVLRIGCFVASGNHILSDLQWVEP